MRYFLLPYYYSHCFCHFFLVSGLFCPLPIPFSTHIGQLFVTLLLFYSALLKSPLFFPAFRDISSVVSSRFFPILFLFFFFWQCVSFFRLFLHLLFFVAGRRRGEASAHFSMGVIHDNLGETRKAIECYQRYLQLCLSTNDLDLQCLGHNSLGVAYYDLGPQYMDKCIYHHKQHLAAADQYGKFVAYSNLGVAYSVIGESEKAYENHQHALRCAIALGSGMYESTK